MKDSTAFTLVGVCLVTVFFTSCERAPVEQPEVVRPIRIATITGLSDGDTLSYPGVIEGAQRAELAFEVSGRLIEFPVREGQNVTQNELLGRLDAADFQSSLDAAEARYRQSSESFQRFSEVFERGAISRQELDLRRQQYEVDQANLDTARKAVADTELRAPFSGYVGRTHVDNFTNVQAKQPILSLQDLSELEIIVNVPEQDWLRAKPGLTLAQRTDNVQPQVSLSSVEGRTFPARISEVAASADPVTRTFVGRARFEPPADISVRPGMSATLTIKIPPGTVQAGSGMLVPANAVVAGEDGTTFVWQVGADMTVSRAGITVGQISGSEVEVVDGLEVGDRIAVSGVQHLRDGMRVRELGN